MKATEPTERDGLPRMKHHKAEVLLREAMLLQLPLDKDQVLLNSKPTPDLRLLLADNLLAQATMLDSVLNPSNSNNSLLLMFK